MSVWIEPGHRWEAPYVTSIPNHVDRRQLLRRVPLPDIHSLVITIDGVIWDGQGRFFHNGQVIQLRSTWYRLGTLPVHALEERVQGINALHHGCHGPTCVKDADLSPSATAFCIKGHFKERLVPWIHDFAVSSTLNNIYLVIQSGPTLFLSLQTPLPPSLDEVQDFYDRYLGVAHGARCVEDARLVWDDACIYLARTAEYPVHTWLLLGGPRLDVYHLSPSQDLSQIPAPPNRHWFASEVRGNVGLAYLRDDQDDTVCPAPSRLAALPAIPPGAHASDRAGGSNVSAHSTRSIFGTSSNGNFTPVEDVEVALETLLATHSVEDLSPDDPTSDQNSSPEGTSPPVSSSSSSSATSGPVGSSPAEGAALLQKRAVAIKVRSLPTPCRAQILPPPLAATPPVPALIASTAGAGSNVDRIVSGSKEPARPFGGASRPCPVGPPVSDPGPPPPQDCSLTMCICLSASQHVLLRIQKDADFQTITAQARRQGFSIDARLLVPVWPQPHACSWYVLRDAGSQHCTLLLRDSRHYTMSPIQVPAGSTGWEACRFLNLLDLDVRVQGRPLCVLPIVFDGLAVDVSYGNLNCMPCRLSLAAALAAEGNELTPLNQACTLLHLLARDKVFVLTSSRTCIALLQRLQAEVFACGEELALSALPSGTQVYLYTDGSQTQQGAGWGFVCYICLPGGRWHFQGCLGASSHAQVFSERRHDSCEAEASAVAAALIWALRLPATTEGAAQAAMGHWAIPLETDGSFRFSHSLARIFYLLHEARGGNVIFQHIHSHTGCVWNDHADLVAGRAASRTMPDIFLPPSWHTVLQGPLCRWLWMLPHGPQSSGLPDVAALITGTAADAVAIGLPPAGPPPVPRPACQVRVLCASFNVCTFAEDARDAGKGLYVPCVQKLLQEQCYEKKLCIVGLQETRLPSAGQHLTEHYLVFNSAAASHNFGCSLWLARNQPCGDEVSSPDLRLGLQHCSTLVSEPRLLAVRVRAPARSWLVIVAHAPHARKPVEEREAWWEHLSDLFTSIRQPADLVFLCIDANARVGKPTSPHIGSFAADVATPNGEAFADFLQLADLYLPSTTDVHVGSSATGFPLRLSGQRRLRRNLTLTSGSSSDLLRYGRTRMFYSCDPIIMRQLWNCHTVPREVICRRANRVFQWIPCSIWPGVTPVIPCLLCLGRYLLMCMRLPSPVLCISVPGHSNVAHLLAQIGHTQWLK